ncbi:MAG: hypothetical protein BIFFINMI_03816 [Phycisphaerae bacterium]|nr:hypothetical protein [Phycisphaerae bacterium]
MSRTAYRYRFDEDVDLDAVRKVLSDCLNGTAKLLGPARVRAEAECLVDESIGVVLIGTNSFVGLVLNATFMAVLSARFGESAFNARQVELIVAIIDGEDGR